VAASLLATMVTETVQSPAAAKPIEKSALANSVRTGPFGPVCTTPSATTIKLLNTGAARTYSIATLTACANYAVPSASPTPSISPTPRPSSTTTATPTPYPSPSLIALPALPPLNSISYSIGANPAGVAATISGDTLTVSTTAAAVDTTLEILATHAYLDLLEGSYEFIDTNAISIPLNIRDAAPPTCQIFTISTSINVPVDVPLAYDPLRSGGCRGGYGVLEYTFDAIAPTNGVPSTKDATTATFTPAAGFQTAQDNTVKATFAVRAKDEYEQLSTPIDQFGRIAGDYDASGVLVRAYAAATITVNVSEPRDCGGWVPKNETVFNNPLANSSRDGRLSNSRFAITNRINNMIDCAQPGSTIAMSWFSFTDDNMVNHLIQAHKNRVNVRVLVNSHATKPSSSSFTAVNTLRAALGSNITEATANASENPGSWLGSCNSGCLTPPPPPGVVFPDETEGEYPALHSKFFMITRAGSAQNVVGISSVNPTYEQARVGFNNASVVVNDRTLFASMNQYYADLANAARGAGKATAYRQLKSDSKTTTYYVYPKSGSDDVLAMLRDIKCVYKVGKKTMRTQIYVNMFVFTRNAPAMELWKKAFASRANNGGCNVHIIYTDMDQRIKALNTRTGKVDFIPNGDRPSAWGAADCLSTMPTRKGKAQKLTGPGLVFDAGKNRMVTAKVCKNGSLQGAIPTINKAGGYCWFNAKNKRTGGSLSMCVSTPLKITAFDKADNRAKLENIADSSGRRWYSHQKYIAIDGMYGKPGKQTRQQVVISGTPNITSPGQRWNDEILTFTTSAEIYAQYVANFNETKAAILRRPGPSGEGRAEARW
jgi:phosphatidylserine/phosphatidylglycerophosphate/cardiolipin synthase-like enzyme